MANRMRYLGCILVFALVGCTSVKPGMNGECQMHGEINIPSRTHNDPEIILAIQQIRTHNMIYKSLCLGGKEDDGNE